MNTRKYFALALIIFGMTSANAAKTEEWFDNAVNRAKAQLLQTAHSINEPGKFPRSVKSDYSIEQLCEQMQCTAADFKPEVELNAHPTRADFRTTYMCNYADYYFLEALNRYQEAFQSK